LVDNDPHCPTWIRHDTPHPASPDPVATLDQPANHLHPVPERYARQAVLRHEHPQPSAPVWLRALRLAGTGSRAAAVRRSNANACFRGGAGGLRQCCAVVLRCGSSRQTSSVWGIGLRQRTVSGVWAICVGSAGTAEAGRGLTRVGMARVCACTGSVSSWAVSSPWRKPGRPLWLTELSEPGPAGVSGSGDHGVLR
jgi:hypothetical protein